jgi:CHAT domain-containing protein
MVFFHAEYLKGRILRAQGGLAAAFSALLHAAELLETIRSRLAGDELRVGFVRNKLEVYSHLMLLAERIAPASERIRLMFDFVERAKSRSLADQMASIGDIAPQALSESAESFQIRQELNALYHDLEKRQLDRLDTAFVRRRIATHEERLKHLVTEQSVNIRNISATADWTPVRLEILMEVLPQSAQIIEFFIAEHRVWAGVIGCGGTSFIDVGSIEPVQEASAFFNFQMSRMSRHSGNEALTSSAQSAALAHLQALYALLIKPIEPLLVAEDLVIVPHGILHSLPFHALYNGTQFLIDRFTVSYAPSATVFCLCRRATSRSRSGSLVMGVPTEANPGIADEVAGISSFLPHPKIFIGPNATTTALFERAGTSRFIHLASHGEFRRDNPLFSSIRLADGPITVLDLYRLNLNAELVTLSGCSTGAGTVAGGDEIVGLSRGLMRAGTRSVLLTLWDVHDASAAQWMMYFYQELFRRQHAAAAARNAMLRLRREWPDAYHWAPFTISGDALSRVVTE